MGFWFSLQYFTAVIMPSVPQSPKPPGMMTPPTFLRFWSTLASFRYCDCMNFSWMDRFAFTADALSASRMDRYA